MSIDSNRPTAVAGFAAPENDATRAPKGTQATDQSTRVNSTTADAAASHCERGFAVVHIPPREKGPKHKNWNQPGGYFTDPEQALLYWQQHPRDNIGTVLEPSGLCSADVDHVEYARLVLADIGIDLDALRDNYPTIQGNPARFRVEFKLPPGVTLPAHKLTWPGQNGSSSVPVFELRAGPVQDVFPPSIHPCGATYQWITPLPAGDLPELPPDLLELWLNWDKHTDSLADLCPWVPRKAPPPPPRGHSQGDGVIAAFNAAHDLPAILELHSYRRKGKRYLAPSSTSKLPGVTILADGALCFSHHATDPLNDGQAHDAFDVFRILDHAGDFRLAVKDAARLLGMEYKIKGNGPNAPRADGGVSRPDCEVEAEEAIFPDEPPDRELPPIDAYIDDSEPKAPPHQAPTAAKGAPAKGDSTYKLMTVDEVLARSIRHDWLVKDYVERNQTCVCYGESQSYKSLLAIELACAISTSTDWRGKKTKHGAVIYIVGEGGGGGLTRRLRAWEIVNRINLKGVPLIFREAPTSLPIDTHDLIAGAKTFLQVRGWKLELIILDTLSRTMQGNENSQEDFARYQQSLDVIRDTFDCAALFLHHTGHADKDRPRGAYSIIGNADVILQMEVLGDKRSKLVARKIKDAETPDAMVFQLATVEIGGYDDDGKPITSVTLRHVQDHQAANQPVGKHEKAAYAILQQLTEAVQDDDVPVHQPVPVTEWRAAFYEDLRETTPGVETNTCKITWNRTRKGLIHKGLVAINGTLATIALSGTGTSRFVPVVGGAVPKNARFYGESGAKPPKMPGTTGTVPVHEPFVPPGNTTGTDGTHTLGCVPVYRCPRPVESTGQQSIGRAVFAGSKTRVPCQCTKQPPPEDAPDSICVYCRGSGYLDVPDTKSYASQSQDEGDSKQPAEQSIACGLCHHFELASDGLGTCAMHGIVVHPTSNPENLGCGDFEREVRP